MGPPGHDPQAVSPLGTGADETIASDTFTIAHETSDFEHAGTLSYTSHGEDLLRRYGSVSVNEDLGAKWSTA